jgi:hypothetical protein
VMRLAHDPATGLFYDESGKKFTRRQAERLFDDFLERRRLERQWGQLWHRTLARNEREAGEGDVNILRELEKLTPLPDVASRVVS